MTKVEYQLSLHYVLHRHTPTAPEIEILFGALMSCFCDQFEKTVGLENLSIQRSEIMVMDAEHPELLPDVYPSAFPFLLRKVEVETQ